MRTRLVGLILLLCVIAIGQSGAQSKGKVLMILRPGNQDAADLMLTAEAAVMKSDLIEAGYAVVVATVTGQPMTGSTASIKANLRLSAVKAADYRGFILPCMAAGNSPVPPETIEVVRKALVLNRPIAAQNSAVLVLSQSGALRDRHFAIEADLASMIADGVYGGIGVVQDGNIVTSGTCPLMARELNKAGGSPLTAQEPCPDCTHALTQRLVTLMRAESGR
jgi:putative intracellular protease/amidase